MFKKVTYCSVALLLVLGFFAEPAGAVGLGIQIPAYGAGTTTVEFDEAASDFDSDYKQIGIVGFIFDTRVASRGVFNYRLGLSWERVTHDFIDPDNAQNRFALDNTFGFAVLQSRVVRLWIGPQLRIAYLTYSREDGDRTAEVDAFGFGIGPVFGANFNFGPVFSLCLDLGYRFSFYGGTAKTDYSYSYSGYYYSDSYESDFAMIEPAFFVNLAFMFRIADVFGY